ncbi:MAG: cation:proton antiporter [Acidobacteria bacterium]|nr:cation:proton antiporter [Acidobacteriota bacterium]
MTGHGDLLTSIGICVIAAASLAFLANRLRQPLILAYLLAGVAIGPVMGLHLVEDKASIETVAEIGLILLLFIIGLEIDLKKLLAAGKPVLVAGILQFPLSVALGLCFFALVGAAGGDGRFDVLYLAVCAAISSTMIVVKLLYDKFELDTLPGRITLGVLVFQDIWAIVVLAIQPNLLDPRVGPLLGSLGAGVVLVIVSLAVSRYVLPPLFRSIAKSPELLLVASLAWCFAVVGGASAAGLSREMGALIAGVSISTFPYNLDVVAKVVSIRDFFVTLFFVALGMQIPVPTATTVGLALAASAFLVASRLAVIFPLLYVLKLGHRTSLLPAINLAQLSEFAIVIATLGLAAGHIAPETLGVLVFAFAIASTASTYLIGASNEVYKPVSRLLSAVGMRDLESNAIAEGEKDHTEKSIVLLGFYREASSLLYEFEREETDQGRHPLLESLLVIDINPQVIDGLGRRGIACLYGDVAHLDTLHHAHIHDAELVVSTIPDSILKGTDNRRLLRSARRLCPTAKVIVSAERIGQALELYAEGADYVYIPRLSSTEQLAKVIEEGLRHGCDQTREDHVRELMARDEVLA